MDAYEATKVVFLWIQVLDSDHAAKIMGFLLIQDHGDKEMIRLAFGPEALLHTVMTKARKDLRLLPASGPGTPTSGHSPFLLSRQNSGRCGAGTAPSPLSVSSPSSWAPLPVFSRSNNATNGVAEEMAGVGEDLMSPAANGNENVGERRRRGNSNVEDVAATAIVVVLEVRGGGEAVEGNGAGPESSAAAAWSGVVCAWRRLDASAAASGVSGGAAAEGSVATAAAA